ncbi:MAG: 3-oxoacyl-ACP synthase [Anaerolineaceae bacterium]|nr:3-oxoacyl-ACP synthase [Anaerolineaceae bacterium]
MAAANGKTRLNGPLRYAHITGWGMAVPETVMTNDDLAAIVETNDEWIRSRTGIRERRIANERESSATLGYKAATAALEVADVLPMDIDLIVVATSTSEHVFPSTANRIQDWLGASKSGAFDLAAACAGFVYAVNMAAQSIRSGSINTALVIGAETMSRVVDWNDRSTCILFGDGAGAVVLQGSDQEGGVLSAVLRSDGAGHDLLSIPTQNVRELNGHRLGKMSMHGGEVFKFATRVVDESIRQVSQDSGITLNEIDLIIPHQANYRILQSAARKLGLDMDKFVSNLDRYGNTSAASIPIALCEAIEQGRIRKDDHLVMVGFGGGLSWAAMTVRWGIPEPSSLQANPLNRQRRRAVYALARIRARWNRLRRAWSNILRWSNPRNIRLMRLRRRANREKLP